MSSIVNVLIDKSALAQMSCIFCHTRFSGAVCSDCEAKLIERKPPFCSTCGIRLVSEIDHCGKCRSKLEQATKAQDNAEANTGTYVHIKASTANAREDIRATNANGNINANTSNNITLQAPLAMFLYIHSLWTYNAYSSRLVSKYKKEGQRLLRYYLASKYLYLLQHYCNDREKVCIVPMPANPSHVRKVGFDHMQLLCKHLHRITNLDILFCITRKASLEQKTLGLKDRFANINNTLFIANKTYKLYSSQQNTKYAYAGKQRGFFATKYTLAEVLAQYSTIVLLDDIVTTGATIEKSARLLAAVDLDIERKLRVLSLVRTEY